jgi:hypothetical protein
MLGNPPSATGPVGPPDKARSWSARALDWLTGSRLAPDRSHWAIAQLDDDRLNDLSEDGLRIRREMRRRHFWWP